MGMRRPGKEAAISLLPTMMTVAVVSIALGSFLLLASHNSRMVARAQAWKAALPLVEAGIEEALTHLNANGQNPGDGWTVDLTNLALKKSRPMEPGNFEVKIALSALDPPVVYSKGYVRLPLSTNYIARTVRVETKKYGWGGIICRNRLNLNGSGTVIDSYDPLDPTASTLGRYDPSKRRDKCFIATISTSPNNLYIGNHHVYGKAGTGPGGTINSNSKGKVGSLSWNALSNTDGRVEPGHYRNDVNFYLPLPSPPFSGTAPSPQPGVFLGLPYSVVFTSGNYRKKNGWKFSGEGIVTGHAVFYVSGGVQINGTLRILPGASLKLFVEGDMDFGSGGHVQIDTGRSEQFQIFGLSEKSKMKFNGQHELTARIYAPGMDIDMVGQSQFYGNIVANNFDLTGAAAMHMDESSGVLLNKYTISSWREL